VGTSPESLDAAVFVNYYLYPHPTKVFRDRWDYVLASVKPNVLVRLDPRLRRTTYEEVRYDEVRRSLVVRDMRLPLQAQPAFAIPIVTPTDGPPPVAYTIEGALAADRPAHVTLTLEPGHEGKALTIEGTKIFHDLVYECFGTLQFVAWIDVRSDVPLRAAF